MLSKFISQNQLSNNIFLLGHKKNVFPYFKKAKGFILSSLWEDPGFVLVEAAFCKVPIFSSDAETGPSELIRNNINKTIFKKNNKKSFLSNFDNYLRNSNNKKMILNNLKESRNFSIFNHYKKLNIFLN